VSSSISGQNERWAQLGAYQPPPISQSGQNPGWGSTNWTTASGGTNASTASAGGASGAQSNDMSFALMAFGNASGNGSVTSSQSAGQSGDASSSGSAAQVGSSLGSQLLTDMQSLLSSLTGTAAPRRTPRMPPPIPGPRPPPASVVLCCRIFRRSHPRSVRQPRAQVPHHPEPSVVRRRGATTLQTPAQMPETEAPEAGTLDTATASRINMLLPPMRPASCQALTARPHRHSAPSTRSWNERDGACCRQAPSPAISAASR